MFGAPELVLPRWQAAAQNLHFASLPLLERSGLGATVSGWELPERVFLVVADEALGGQHCRGEFDRWRFNLPLPDTLRDGEARLFNRTVKLLEVGAPWHHVIADTAVMDLADFALALRVFCASTSRCAQALGSWGHAWCLFARRLHRATAALPPEGFVVSALNTSAAALLQLALPAALAVPLAGLANGKWSIEDSITMLENCTVVFGEYVEHALLLGREASRFGRSRVARALFHGESGDAGARREGRLHRGDVLLWALANSSTTSTTTPLPVAAEPEQRQRAAASQPKGPQAENAPLVVELGVRKGECAERLLLDHDTLRWIGVDTFGDSFKDLTVLPDGASSRGPYLLRQATVRLRPWLGWRAQLLISRTAEAVEVVCGQGLDLIFVDAEHSREAAFADLSGWARCVRAGGIVAGHDYQHYFPGVVEAVHEALPPGSTLHLGVDMVYWWHV